MPFPVPLAPELILSKEGSLLVAIQVQPALAVTFTEFVLALGPKLLRSRGDRVTAVRAILRNIEDQPGNRDAPGPLTGVWIGRNTKTNRAIAIAAGTGRDGNKRIVADSRPGAATGRRYIDNPSAAADPEVLRGWVEAERVNSNLQRA